MRGAETILTMHDRPRLGGGAAGPHQEMPATSRPSGVVTKTRNQKNFLDNPFGDHPRWNDIEVALHLLDRPSDPASQAG